MRRLFAQVCAILTVFLAIGGLTSCGSSATSTSPIGTPTTVTLSPADSSVDLGSTLQFTASARNGAGSVNVPFVYTSSNPAVLSFIPSAGGLACAGRWDTLGQICTPTGAGFAQVTASGNGVTSAPVNVYVHQHIDTITLSPYNPPIPQPDCITLAQAPGIQNFLDFQAQAFSNGMEVTNTVGSFTFSQTNSTVAKISTTDPSLNNNNGNQILRARFTAAVPGLTQIFASAAGVTSLPAEVPDSKGHLHPYFETCLVQSVNLQVGNATTNTSFAVTSNLSAGVNVTPTIIDRLGNTLDNPVPAVSFISSSPPNATVTATAGTGPTAGTAGVKTSAPGAVSITAVCAPPTCNVGVDPPQPVYSTTTPANGDYVGTPITGLITGSPVTSKNVYVTTTQCDTAAGAPINGCQPLLFPIPVKTNAAGNSVTLPSSPNSFIFSPKSDKAYLGSSSGLMVFTPTSSTNSSPVAQFTSLPGKVLAVSLDGNTAVVSDTLSIPNQVYVVTNLESGTPSPSPLLINSATAAAFSPDGLKIFILGNPTPSNPTVPPTLYVYSTVLALKQIPLSAPAIAASFYPNSALAFLNGGAAGAVTMRNTCDTSYAQVASFPGRNPVLFQGLSDGVHAVGVESPGIDVFSVAVGAPPVATLTSPQTQLVTCPFPVTSATSSFVNIGQGTFTPLKMLVAPDNSRVYILASNLGSVFAFDLGVNTVTAIPLTGNPVPLDASLTSDGVTMYVGTTDGSVHVLSTVSNVDLQEVTFVNNNSSNKSSLCSNIPQTCNPDLIAVQP